MKESISINIILAVLAKHGKVMPNYRSLDIACAKEIYDALNQPTAEPEYDCPYCKDTRKGTMSMGKTKVKVKCHYCGGKQS